MRIEHTGQERSQVTVVLAMSADGKIADRDRTAARFSSTNDLAHLETLVAQADAVLFGAGTLKAYGTCLSVRQPALLERRAARNQTSQPIQIVCSQSGNVDPQWRFFQQSVPRWLLTSAAGAQRWSAIAQHDASYFDRVVPDLTEPMDWRSLLQRFHTMGLERVALLGGGTLVASFAEQDLIDEVYLTVCPLLLGGKTAPTPFDGKGLAIAQALPLQLVDVRQVEHEVFLHYRRCHPKGD
ncbi:RibD family protein [Leptolyngbya iicbica]|uniref:RibD family protein n=2 Tax=Cyanophyceae TaxID=3028117 RepID=A0A4Q7E250_9CYAN|nr:RibD family protein [Leptolyngbya sp. LK]RZM75419.1 RibD family protein [Leptolyngbya sp. LK]